MRLIVSLVVALVAVAAVDAPDEPKTGLSTLYHLDPITTRVSFDDRPDGGAFQGDGLYNSGSDLDFGHHVDGRFTVGIEGGRMGAMLDLGPLDALPERLGVPDLPRLQDGGQAFASIRAWRDTLGGTGYTLGTIDELLPLADFGTAGIDLGHVYLARIAEPDGSDERLVKFIVVDHEPDVRVTLRWVVLERDVG